MRTIGSVFLAGSLAAAAVGLHLAPATARADRDGILDRDRDRDKDWKKLGEKKVEEKLEQDEIEVGRDEGMFRAIKLEVRDADVEILKVRVVYARGGYGDFDVRHKIKEGGQTRPLDLKGGDRAIRVDRPAGWLLVPYALWVGFAAELNADIWRLNRRRAWPAGPTFHRRGKSHAQRRS